MHLSPSSISALVPSHRSGNWKYCDGNIKKKKKIKNSNNVVNCRNNKNMTLAEMVKEECLLNGKSRVKDGKMVF